MSCGVFSALRAALRLPPEEPRADKPSKRVSPANPGFTPYAFHNMMDCLAECNTVVAAHRRCGKSAWITKSALDYAVKHPGSRVVIVSGQYSEAATLATYANLFVDPHCFKVKSPTQTQLVNGSLIQVFRAGGPSRGGHKSLGCFGKTPLLLKCATLSPQTGTFHPTRSTS